MEEGCFNKTAPSPVPATGDSTAEFATNLAIDATTDEDVHRSMGVVLGVPGVGVVRCVQILHVVVGLAGRPRIWVVS